MACSRGKGIAMRIMLDTNILIDLFACREEFYREALEIKAMGLYGDAELWVSAKSFTDVFFVMRHREGFSSGEIQDIFLKNMDYLNVCSVDGADIIKAANLKWPDFEDCLVSCCADKANADFLLTRDKKGFRRANVAACSPAEFFVWLEEEYGIVYDEIDM